jgi:hypothetical protein
MTTHNSEETMGDVYTSGALSRAYSDKILQLRTNELQRALVQPSP